MRDRLEYPRTLTQTPNLRSLDAQGYWPSQAATTLAGLVLVIAAAAVLPPTCLSQSDATITVRALKAKDGKPVKDIIIRLFYPKREHAVASAITNADGIALLSLPKPVPEHIDLYYATFNKFYACSHMKALLKDLSTTEIFKSGMVAPNVCPGNKLHYAEPPKPGELVVFGRRPTWRERMLAGH